MASNYKYNKNQNSLRTWVPSFGDSVLNGASTWNCVSLVDRTLPYEDRYTSASTDFYIVIRPTWTNVLH